MENMISGIKIAIYDFIGYVLPGLLLVFIISPIIGQKGLITVFNNIWVFLLLSYPLGQILHSLSVILDVSPKKYGWRIYHSLKEQDSKGHGVNNPKTVEGKIAARIRSLIEDKNSDLSFTKVTNDLLVKSFDLESMHGLDLFMLKETILANNQGVSGTYDYLQYQKTFNKSLSLIFAITAVVTVLVEYGSSFKLYLSNDHVVATPYLATVYFVVNLAFCVIFYKRAMFFKKYREKVINSAVLIYLKEKLSE
ncbi:hypothetical protein JXA63_01760 [Candidatus Woesebacteria bacterium]|nr:hypothetical protein [Candidatus Woesebacteria bacterium]